MSEHLKEPWQSLKGKSPREINLLPVPLRLSYNIVVDDNGCWIWQGNVSGPGYGTLNLAGKSRLAHRISYELFIGHIPEGLDLDHLCRVRRCINPNHLEPVTRKVNLHRGETWKWRLDKLTCKYGHPLEGSNLRKGKGRERICIACDNRRSRERNARRRAEKR